MSSDIASWYVSDLAIEYVKARVTPPSTVADPTSGTTVTFAFVTREAEPVGGDWNSGSWETESVVTPNGTTTIYRARCKVGTGGKVLAQGSYDVYVKISGASTGETVVRLVGILEVGA